MIQDALAVIPNQPTVLKYWRYSKHWSSHLLDSCFHHPPLGEQDIELPLRWFFSTSSCACCTSFFLLCQEMLPSALRPQFTLYIMLSKNTVTLSNLNWTEQHLQYTNSEEEFLPTAGKSSKTSTVYNVNVLLVLLTFGCHLNAAVMSRLSQKYHLIPVVKEIYIILVTTKIFIQQQFVSCETRVYF